ncbi:MSHA biogenesis protein MshM [Geothermobacter ehrlichii]|uniref:MSHA biogenesis protein MshM n=1 Tax=Geothermobacter ehrlichii TaxID=213224 RepID=A0A5D3WLZ5_9BACT|nr:AAA family ATPase [Geothermobacter ehrlichii]TYO99047.1 MSHA biogenesis protein MshM [Geothermobacter ehrlichii]
MYLSHFGLNQTPFSLTPDLDFYFSCPGHRQALNVLQLAIEEGEGFIKITGEVGTGKTLLCRKLLDLLQPSHQAAYLPNPLLGPLELHRAIAEEIGAGPLGGTESLHELQRLILARCLELGEQGKRVVVCLDEAQAMSDVSLEALRLLSNLETEKRKLLQIVLFAQPELDVRLEQPHLRQLRQRIGFAHHLVPLDRQGVCDYIAHRVQIAGRKLGPLFTPAACRLIARASRGVPRLVNILCHKALLTAYAQGDPRVERRHAVAAARDTAEVQAPFSWRDRPTLLWGIGVVTLVELALVTWLLKGGW